MNIPVTKNSEEWGIQDSRTVYNIDRWGAGYFDIDDAGNVVANPLSKEGASVVLMDVVEEATSKDLNTPLLIRFQDIVRHRVQAVNEAFRGSIEQFNYKNRYRGVFPVKVNQLREVVEEILDAGKPYQFGLEVGSKPEMFAALALQSQKDSLIVCNGYKDAEFIRMALLGIQLGKKVVLVIEKLEELSQILEISRQTGVEPTLGIRVRLRTKASGGKWSDSGGENAKFGLTTAEILTALEMLKKEHKEHCLKLLHFHIGSQLPDILTIKRAIQEGARFYAKLYKMGFKIEYMDVGGGLGVDYDGSRCAFDSSMNYTLQEYTNDIVFYLGDICDVENVPHPEIVSESGRAIVAHHSVLIIKVLGAIEKIHKCKLQNVDQEHALVRELTEIRDNLDNLNKIEAYHDAAERREDAHHMFNLGLLDLPEKAMIENLYWEIAKAVVESFKAQPHIPEEILELEESLSDQYLCNFSVFQSLLDHWALGQLFPIMPISRLNEKPTRDATLVDITCDSDGQVNKFIDLKDVRDTLPLHPLKESGNTFEPYFLGIFLMGAYQDIMGDLHNLFGRVNEAHVFLDPDEPAGYYVEETIKGNTITQSLSAVQYDENELKRQMKAQIDEAIRTDKLKPSDAMRLLADYDRGLKQYTYLSI
ncbi:MAG: biosynthetic arginine decarboxylase [Verrucomicrobia bacterium]|nr:biosynthetic arginine decarboxylase [Verrucomicrobiota bacterium]